MERYKEDYLSYAKARNQARSACRKAVRLYEKDIASQIKQNPKHFWRYVKSKLNVRHGVPNLEREDGTLTETDFDKAEVLNSFFKRSIRWRMTQIYPILLSRGGCYIPHKKSPSQRMIMKDSSRN